MTTTTGLRERIEAFAGELREEFGEIDAAGYDCLFSAIEDLAANLGDELARSLIVQQATEKREARAEECCPSCQRPGRWKGQRPRRLQTRRGEIEIHEPEYYCSACRKSFFPGEQTVGDRA